MSKPLVSVIIPVYNDEKRIIDCVTSVYEQAQLNYSLEVIVVDNGSSDNTLSVIESELKIKYKDLIVETCEVPGSYAARNLGLSVCSGNFTAFTDSDCIVSKNWLDHHLENIEGHTNSISAGEVKFFAEDSKKTEQSAIDFENLFSMKQKDNAASGKCITANFFCYRNLFNEAGVFDASLKSGGDVEMSGRVVKKGGSVVYSEKAVVEHPSRNKNELIIKRKRIIGGTWDSVLSSSDILNKFNFVIRLLKMFFGRSKKVIKNSSLSIRRKLGLIGLLFSIFLVSITELVALSFGKQSNRQ
ncbi:glycosyltransferase [Alteromonas sp. P256]|uniref:glycosyltransferase n=1 Tax=Alteromonas sp. P256 TaxID=3117399 RepID=UPI002FE36668